MTISGCIPFVDNEALSSDSSTNGLVIIDMQTIFLTMYNVIDDEVCHHPVCHLDTLQLCLFVHLVILVKFPHVLLDGENALVCSY